MLVFASGIDVFAQCIFCGGHSSSPFARLWCVSFVKSRRLYGWCLFYSWPESRTWHPDSSLAWNLCVCEPQCHYSILVLYFSLTLHSAALGCVTSHCNFSTCQSDCFMLHYSFLRDYTCSYRQQDLLSSILFLLHELDWFSFCDCKIL